MAGDETPAVITLDDVVWGDVVAEIDGAMVVEGVVVLDDQDCQVLVKRYRDHEDIADAANHLLLAQLGVPVLRVLAHGAGWLVLEHPCETWGWRLADAPDALDDRLALAVEAWRHELAAAAQAMPELAVGARLELGELSWAALAVRADLGAVMPFDLRSLQVVHG